MMYVCGLGINTEGTIIQFFIGKNFPQGKGWRKKRTNQRANELVTIPDR